MSLNKKLTNIILNEKETAERKAVLKSYPRQIHVLLNSKCNLKCRMCGIFADKYSLSDSRFKELIKLMPYLQLLIIQGGEVFLDNRIYEILKQAAKYQVKVDLLTNGLLINGKIAELIAGSSVNLVFSIDSPFKKTYEDIRSGAKFEKLIENINIINRKRIENKSIMQTAINMVVMKNNYKHIGEMIEFAKQYKFNTLILSAAAGRLTGSEQEKLQRLKLNESIQKKITLKIKSYKERAKKSGVKLFNHIPLSSVKKNTQIPAFVANKGFCKMPF